MRTWLVILCLWSVAAQATVYKWVDKDGNIHYSDQPHADAQQVQLRENTSNQVSMPPVKPISVANDSEETTEQKTRYQVSIVSPHHEETIRDNAGDFTVTGKFNHNWRPAIICSCILMASPPLTPKPQPCSP
ncbi:DUF4124 domain-containing protein [Shewanella dokdonensis]|uniref:DUF4124 domain-containing protein n=1 Tax=Shewanella dokdonensis TaxID=712036 RepID=UPI001FD6165E|nr:DUF4124 domain-containing protein [Shewanella dokdonensis]